MPTGIHSQAWSIAGHTLAVVAIVLLTGGTLYLVYDGLNPAPPPTPLPVQKRLLTSHPPPTRADPLPVATPEPGPRPPGDTPKPMEAAPPPVLVPHSPVPPRPKPVGSSPPVAPPLPTVSVMDPAAADPDLPFPEEDVPVLEGGDFSIAGRVLTNTGESVEGIEVSASVKRLFQDDPPMASPPPAQRIVTD